MFVGMSVGLSVCPTNLFTGVSRRELKHEIVISHGTSIKYFSRGGWVEKMGEQVLIQN